MSGLDYERTVLAGIQIGIMQACLDCVLPYVRERKQFGKPIGSFQLMQAKIADMYVALNTARAPTSTRSPRHATQARRRASTPRSRPSPHFRDASRMVLAASWRVVRPASQALATW